MTNTLLDKIDELLLIEGFNTKQTTGYIEWKDTSGSEYSIYYGDVADNGETIAWFQNNEYGNCFIRIMFKNNTTFNWMLSSNHHSYGFDCNFIRWFGNKLIIIYKEKHSHYLVKIENFNVDILFVGYIVGIYLTEDNIFYIKQMDNKGIIQRLSINIYQTLINSIPEMNLNSLPNVSLEKIHDFHSKLERNYNKKTK